MQSVFVRIPFFPSKSKRGSHHDTSHQSAKIFLKSSSLAKTSLRMLCQSLLSILKVCGVLQSDEEHVRTVAKDSTQNIFTTLSEDIVVAILTQWVTIRDLQKVDAAVYNRRARPMLLACLHAKGFVIIPTGKGGTIGDLTDLTWLMTRSVAAESISLSLRIWPKLLNNCVLSNYWQNVGSNILSLNLRGSNLTDMNAGGALSSCVNLHTLMELNISSMTVENVDLFGVSCVKLQKLVVVLDENIDQDKVDALGKAKFQCLANLTVLLGCGLAYTDDFVNIITCQYGVGLSKLTIVNHKPYSDSRISDVGFNYISKNCPNLLHLEAQRAKSVTDQAMEHLAAGCKHLQYLNFNYCKAITSAGLIALTRDCSCKHLLVLGLEGCNAVTNEGVIAIAENCAKLQRIFLGYIRPGISDPAVNALLRYCPDLDLICLSYVGSYPISLAAQQAMRRRNVCSYWIAVKDNCKFSDNDWWNLQPK